LKYYSRIVGEVPAPYLPGQTRCHHAATMPRYAIEKMDADERCEWMGGRFELFRLNHSTLLKFFF